MRVWLDDRREMRDGFDVHARTATEAIALLRSGGVEFLSLDHDLGDDEDGTGYTVAKFVEAEAFHGRQAPPGWAIHTDNPVGRRNMRSSLENADRYWATRGSRD